MTDEPLAGLTVPMPGGWCCYLYVPRQMTEPDWNYLQSVIDAFRPGIVSIELTAAVAIADVLTLCHRRAA